MRTPRPRAFALAAALASAVVGASAQQPTDPLARLSLGGDGLTAQVDSLLRAAHVRLLRRLPDGTYLIRGAPPAGVGEVVALSPVRSRDAAPPRRLGFHAAEPDGTRVRIDLVLAFPTAPAHLEEVLAEADFAAAGLQVEGGVTLRGSLPHARLASLLRHPLVLGAEAVALDDAPAPYNYEARAAHGLSQLATAGPGAPGLDGTGVVVGLGDGGALGGHPDLGDRVVYSTDDYRDDWGAHPDMVAGVLAGGGVIDPRHRGAASAVELVIEDAEAVTARALTLHAAYGMTLTNNSYGPAFRCSAAGRYAASSASIDQQLFGEPALLHVYAAGNHGQRDCENAPGEGYGTLPGGAQTAKNALTVGNVTPERRYYSTSAAGPTRDGRLKPDLVGVGTTVSTPDRDRGYRSGTGTSYAAPGVAGALALLTQRYRELHRGADPPGALLKAIACLTAEDLGPAGPDYRYGFGLLDARRALGVLERATYERRELAPGARSTLDVDVPAGATELRALLYYHDQAGSPYHPDPRRLVSDLDLAAVTPAGDTLRPWTLDPDQPAAPALRTRDSLNNAELVTLANPPPGRYTLVARARELPYGRLDFLLGWDVRAPQLELTCPHDGESLRPGASTFVAWSAAPGVEGPWRLEMRRPGADWQLVAAGIPTEARSLRFTPPAEPGPLELRIASAAADLADATELPLELIAPPLGLAGAAYCGGGIRLTWSPVSGAAAYEVYAYDGDVMSRVATVDHPGTILPAGSSPEGLYSVSAVAASGRVSARAYAIAQADAGDAGAGDCLGPEQAVAWGRLRAEDTHGGVRVRWRVDSERDNDYFEVLALLGNERGDTASAYRVVGRIEGRGTALSPADYVIVDALAPVIGDLEYRVRQVCRDGAVGYSEVVGLARGAEQVSSATSAAHLGPTAVRLLRNPIRDFADVASAVAQPLSAQLVDLANRPHVTWEVPPGTSRFDLPAGLAPGVYVIRVPATGQALKVVVE